MERYFATIDTKADEITAVAARWRKNGSCVLEDFCRFKSKGFGKGIVTDINEGAGSIAEVLNKLMRKTGRRIQDVYAAVSSESIDIIPSSGVILLSKYGREVLEADIKKCVDIGSTTKISLNKEALHKIVKEFYIDEERGIKNPLNLEGVKLGVDVNVLTINASVLHNMSKCIAQAGFVPAGFVFSGLASSYRVLTDEDKAISVALLNICKDLTEVVFFNRGILDNCRVFSIGTNDILSKEENIDEIVLEKLYSQITALSGWKKIHKVFIIEEGTLIDELVEFSEKYFNIPVSTGICYAKSFEELPPERTGYVGSLGILDYLQEENKWKYTTSSMVRRNFNKVLRFVDKYF